MRMARLMTVGVAVVALSACGDRGVGGSKQAATVNCEGEACTVTYPAKARNNQSSSGGPPAEVLGVQTQLFSISGGQANFRINDQPVTIEAGKKKTVGDLSVQAVEVSDTQAVLKYSKTKAKAKATPKATAKSKSKS